MNIDFRVHVDYFSHPKTVALVAANGPEAALWPLRLWAFTAKHKPKGSLGRMTPEELALALGFDGPRTNGGADPQRHPVIELERCGFLHLTRRGFTVHGWTERNSFAARAEQRNDAARIAGKASARKRKELGCQRQPNGSFGGSFNPLNPKPLTLNPKPEDSGNSDVGEVSPTPLLLDAPQPAIERRVAVPRRPPTRKAGPSPLVLPAERLEELAAWFDWLYRAYPRHVGRDKAWQALLKLEPELSADVVKAMGRDVKRRVDAGEWQPEDPERKRFIPHLATYLHGRRWTDED